MNQNIQQFKTDFFKALAHPLRIRILEVLSEGDRSVTEIQSLLGSEGSAVSQQLANLRDPLIKDLLLVAKQIFDNHLVDTISFLEDMRDKTQQAQEK